MTMLSRDQIIAQITPMFDADRVRIDAATLQSHGCDYTRMYPVDPVAIVFPTRIEQVQTLVRFAHANRIGIVPSGGRTGLSGGAVASNGEIVVSFEQMNGISALNTIDRTVVCQPGVITQQLQTFAEQHELYYPVDFASAGSSHIGGNIATNAGGIKVIRYGMTRDWVAGLKVVTGTGELLTLNNDLLKNNTGYDLRHLFVASEGTLGLIVEATMRLTTPPQHLTAVVLGVPSMDGLMKVLQTFQQRLDLTAFEFFSESGVNILTEHGVQRPFETPTPFYVLLEYQKMGDADDRALAAFEICLAHAWAIDGVISQSETQFQNLWALRENLSETCSAYTPYKNDLSVTVSNVPGFLAEIDDVVAKNYPNFVIVWWGHIGDGNIHLNILKPEQMAKETFYADCKVVSRQVFQIVQRYNGSISAEHGVGLVKKDDLHYTRPQVEIEIMKGVKAVFDPVGIMNPGKLV